ncbi:formimidoylglutamase [Haloarchaeobius sp. HME9146]|uniref:formimidoylglutamase n=1 Tax=Haloarchaeobius sp. HME9146 TaxID=2978732 RepID=UPI0021C24A3C|nr:formimidoylglutamase [Haloarchaeobius sp. HME9146]MCT9098502.1 formimidoylglutamase [Haloarchaeobius sp. HME9146]
MTTFTEPPVWQGTSSDPNDVQFGDVVAQATLDTAGDYDAVIVGEPYDGAVIGRKGAADGPDAIRDSLAGVKTHHFDAGPVSGIADLGDVAIPSGDVAMVQDIVADTTAAVHETDALPVFLGGDNSLTVPNVSPLLESGSVGVLNFDAHLDCREVPDDGPTSGTPYRQLFEKGLESYACVGARHFETSTRYDDFVREHEAEIRVAEEVGDDAVDAVDKAINSLGDVDHVYVSVDVDVLDAAFAPGASAPTPGGITTRELYRMLRLAASDDRVAGFEVVETAPSLDRDGLTVDAAARAVAHFLAGWSA